MGSEERSAEPKLDRLMGDRCYWQALAEQVNAQADGWAPQVSVVVPVFNEAECVGPVLAAIVDGLRDRPGCEVIAVDDGSTDDTPAQLAAARRQMPHLRCLRHERRCGKSAAIRTGVRVARGTVVVTIDGDGQSDAADIARVLAALEGGSGGLGLVAGERQQRCDPPLRRWSSRLANGIRVRLLRDRARDSACGLKAFPRAAFLALPFFDGMHRFLPALMQREGFAVAFVPVQHRPRLAGHSKYGVWDRVWVGLLDTLAVYWLMRRATMPRYIEELFTVDEAPR
jgi:dolichol-phosphate mannosyltransferase